MNIEQILEELNSFSYTDVYDETDVVSLAQAERLVRTAYDAGIIKGEEMMVNVVKQLTTKL